MTFEVPSYLLCFDSEVLLLRLVKRFCSHIVTFDNAKVYQQY